MDPVDIALHGLIRLLGDDTKTFLVRCVQNLQVSPRYRLVSILDTLMTKILMKDPKNPKTAELVDSFKADYKNWVFSPEASNFTKKYYKNSDGRITITIPRHIKNKYAEFFGQGSNIDTDLKNMLSQEDNESIKDLLAAYMQQWKQGSAVKVEKVYHASEVIAEKDHGEFRRGRQEAGQITDNFLGHQMKIEASEESNEKQVEKLKRGADKVNLFYKSSTREIKKADQERFVKIFDQFNINNPDVTSLITRIWYADVNSDDQDSMCILNIIKMKKLKIKISDSVISSATSRLILQTYVAGLIIGKSVFEIFTCVNAIDNQVSPDLIYHKGKPTNKVQEVLSGIITSLYLQPGTPELNLRINWEKILSPKINITYLVEFLTANQDIGESSKYLIFQEIKDLNPHTSIEKFTKSVHLIIRSHSIRTVPENSIKKTLRFY